MRITWNKVTWYSKLVALILFVALPFIGFWLGAKYGETVAPLYQASIPTSSSTTSSGEPAYYSNVAEWQTDQRPDAGLTIAYPIDFEVDDNYAITPVPDWRIGSQNQPGRKLITITIPRAFEPQTNFIDAALTIGLSNQQDAVQQCLTPDQTGVPNAGAPATTTINGIVFTIFQSADAGAGNYYQTTSYRTLHAGACYAVEYTLHSSQILNYPAQ